ncbi:hypothetical protein [Nocardioides sp. InS609-2]|uniref:hypothetical protein n=1 Tax=Nocardioides sp. InS609-2 TaxID=2760705 RepID=UPI0020C01671|nr:hypothetical protein [Nocardioides sp. InS609-2]
MAGAGEVERFAATGGRVIGVFTVVMAAGLVILAVAERDESWALSLGLAGLALGAIAWASMLRPALAIDDDRLVMRNMVDTVHVPLAAIEQIAVRQVLAVRAGEKRYVSPVVGKTRRKMRRAEKGAKSEQPKQGEIAYPDFVEERIRRRAEDARAERGIAMLSDEQLVLAADVRREWAWPVIALMAVPMVLFVVTLLL